jgi:glycosyltransferase involved in cell wall biosynthesis
MKILYAIHQFYPETSGGTEHFLLNLAHAMQRAGHRADVIAYSQADFGKGDRSHPLQRHDYIHERLPVTSFRHSRSFPELNTAAWDSEVASFARERLREGAYDLLHVVHPMRVASYATAAAEVGVPYVITLTDFWTLCPKITLQTSYGSLCSGPEDGRACAQFCPELSFEHVSSRLTAIHSMLRGASAVITPSDFAAALVRKQYPDLAVTVVPHGLNRSYFPDSAKIYASGSTIVFGYCGGLAPHKGVHLLVSAFRRVASRKVSLRIFGAAGPSDKAYERELRKLAAADQRIEFRGPYRPDEAGKILQSVDVLVIPSLWYETYSFSLHEAFACGVPVIASEIGVLAEKIKAGENGLTFHLGDENDLEQQLKLVVEEPELLNSFKQNLIGSVPHMEEEEGYFYERIYRLALAGLNPART